MLYEQVRHVSLTLHLIILISQAKWSTLYLSLLTFILLPVLNHLSRNLHQIFFTFSLASAFTFLLAPSSQPISNLKPYQDSLNLKYPSLIPMSYYECFIISLLSPHISPKC